MKFKVGDRFRVVTKEEGDPCEIGDVGTILDSARAPYVMFDVYRPGMLSLVDRLDCLWCMKQSQLEAE